VAGPEGRLSGAGPWDPPLTGKKASHTSGGPFRKSSEAFVRARVTTLVVTSG
jgi:hypothetical protein